MSADRAAGGCFCGAVRYEARARPTASMVCHCRTCARTAGAPAVPWVTFPADAFAFVAGRPAELRSSPSVVRTFCGACGTPLTYRRSDRTAEVDVTTSSLDAPDAFPPTYHAWESHKPRWCACPAGMPAYDEGSAA